MKNLLFLFACLMLACNTTNSPGKKGDDQNPNQNPTEQNDYIRAKYESAAVYAAATDYRFVTDAGQQILIRVSHIEPEGNPDINVNLLEVMEEVEGPPAADPSLVGKYFKLYKDGDGNYIRILIEE
jgi:hypothetical protein